MWNLNPIWDLGSDLRMMKRSEGWPVRRTSTYSITDNHTQYLQQRDGGKDGE